MIWVPGRNRNYNIVPGRPEDSILEYRIASTDPGVMMPELNRKLVHHEGVKLIHHKPFVDERGYFTRLYCKKTFSSHENRVHIIYIET